MNTIFTAKAGKTQKLSEAFDKMKDLLLSKLGNTWKTYTIEVKSKRQGKRYRRYFGYVVRPIFESGVLTMEAVNDDELYSFTPDDVHEALKSKYCGMWVTNTVTGEQERTNFSTKKLSDLDFIAKYSEKIIADFSSYGVKFPELPELDKWDADTYEFDGFIMTTNDDL